MADIREVFSILADATTGAGEPAIARDEGEAPATGLTAFSFTDSSGNLVLPELDDQGRLPVTLDAVAGECKYAFGELAAGSLASFAKITGAEIALTAGKTYSKIGISGSATRTTVIELVHIDDEGVTDTEVVLMRFVVGPGQFSYCCDLNCLEIDTTGGTGTIVLTARGSNLFKASCIRATINTLEEV